MSTIHKEIEMSRFTDALTDLEYEGKVSISTLYSMADLAEEMGNEVFGDKIRDIAETVEVAIFELFESYQEETKGELAYERQLAASIMSDLLHNTNELNKE
jgi:hypothetical protein